MSNEWFFLLSLLADLLFVSFAARRGTEWLFSTIAVNLILVAIFGSKLISVFGLVTNAGNIFYACVFLSTHILIERHGKRTGFRSIWFGVFFMVFFALMSQLTTKFSGLSLSSEANVAIVTLFSSSLRVAFASVLAYTFAQYVNVSIYECLKTYTKDKYLWLRSNGANIVAQLVDSLLFFSIAFFDLPGTILLQTILVGWLFKTLIVFIGTPLLYLNTYMEKRKS